MSQAFIKWDTVRDEVLPLGEHMQYEGYVSSYVEQCPFNLFDIRRQRTISRSELKDDIVAALMRWIKIPLTCSDILDVVANIESSSGSWQYDEEPQYLRSFIFSAMTKNPLIDGEASFLSTLGDELRLYSKGRSAYLDPLPIDSVFDAVRVLIDAKRAQQSIPSHHIDEQIALFGQYVILSHRWCQDGQELSYNDSANISDPKVQAKQGYKKLAGFWTTVESNYGSRYLWVDSLCIQESDRSVSIPRMFDWYQHAYACLILYDGEWSHRGWTLQEFLAASRIKFFTSAWVPDQENTKFDAFRGGFTISELYSRLRSSLGYLDWDNYTPGPDHAFHLLYAMRDRETTLPEDMVYCLLSALNINIPVEYGQGFDRAFYRFQVECLTRVPDRRFLIWDSPSSSPYNSMLSPNMKVFNPSIYGDDVANFEGIEYSPPNPLPDASISFDADGVMRIMLSLHPWPPPPPRASVSPVNILLSRSKVASKPARNVKHEQGGVVFASLGTLGDTLQHVGVLLRRIGSRSEGPTDAVMKEERVIYERIGLQYCKSYEISSANLNWVCIK